MSMPIVPASAPMAAITAFLAGSEPPMVETATRQNRMRAKYSAGPKAMATSTITGVSRSEEHTSELQSLMRTSYAVFCLKKKKQERNIKSSLIYTHKKQKNNI